MGLIFKPDKVINRRKMIEEAIRDLDPSSREAIRHIITSMNDSLILDDKRFKELLEKIENMKRSYQRNHTKIS